MLGAFAFAFVSRTGSDSAGFEYGWGNFDEMFGIVSSDTLGLSQAASVSQVYFSSSDPTVIALYVHSILSTGVNIGWRL